MTRLRFAEFEADLRAGELWRNGERIRVQDLPFRLLAALLERPGELVTRAELVQRLWGGETFVDFDAGLNTAVAKLREALGDSAESPRVIETVPKRGYRLLVPVTPVADTTPLAQTAAVTQPRPRTSLTRRVAIAAGLVVVAAALGAYWRTSAGPTTRVAVVLFDNETGRQEFDRLAQTLTDSVVLRLGGERRLAVIGNAAILRTDRPFRDLKAIRESVGADLIVIGQVQQKAEGYRVMTHLIRASDEAHVWVKETLFATGGEPTLERDVVDALAQAVISSPSAPNQDRESSASAVRTSPRTGCAWQMTRSGKTHATRRA
ncbi:MAG TPA: winged helix-turn-helix domain-containing protein [Vicinamibacterales bacterium]|nr:winged helix-turn-helix domain-containing protein [Vicinamibacterales bacterium]